MNIGKKGNSLVDVLIALVLVTGASVYMMQSMISDRRIAIEQSRRLAAMVSAQELVELFRIMNSDEVKDYLAETAASYKLCNFLGNLKEVGDSTMLIGYSRRYRVEVIDVKSMKVKKELCGSKVMALGADERFLITVQVENLHPVDKRFFPSAVLSTVSVGSQPKG